MQQLCKVHLATSHSNVTVFPPPAPMRTYVTVITANPKTLRKRPPSPCATPKTIENDHVKRLRKKNHAIIIDRSFRTQRSAAANFSACALDKMADADSLEYYVKFPSPGFSGGVRHRDSEYVFVVDEDKLPVVLLFGWAGCQDKYLSKYSKIYEEKG